MQLALLVALVLPPLACATPDRALQPPGVRRARDQQPLSVTSPTWTDAAFRAAASRFRFEADAFRPADRLVAQVLMKLQKPGLPETRPQPWDPKPGELPPAGPPPESKTEEPSTKDFTAADTSKGMPPPGLPWTPPPPPPEMVRAAGGRERWAAWQVPQGGGEQRSQASYAR